MLLGEKLSIPFDLYINSATKTTGLFDFRNIEGQNHSKHTREEKIIEKYNLEVALKFRDFQGLALEKT